MLAMSAGLRGVCGGLPATVETLMRGHPTSLEIERRRPDEILYQTTIYLARSMYVCILDNEGNTLVHQNIKTCRRSFLAVIQPYQEDLAVAMECIFTWYWIADLCRQQGIAFVLGHALYMRAIHGGKAKNDKIDSQKIALLLKGGLIPQGYAYPAERRATRDLLRRRMHLARERADLIAHIQNTVSQYNLPPLS